LGLLRLLAAALQQIPPQMALLADREGVGVVHHLIKLVVLELLAKVMLAEAVIQRTILAEVEVGLGLLD
jgi:hypothetical protein